MFTLTKEKNLIYIQDSEKANPYKIDINTGLAYGLSGRQVKQIPAKAFNQFFGYYTNNKENPMDNTLIKLVIRDATEGYASHLPNLQRYVNILAIADSLDNMGIKGIDGFSSINQLKELTENKQLFKEYIAYAKAEIEKGNNKYSYQKFMNERECQIFISKFGFDVRDNRYANYRSSLLEIGGWATPRQMKCFIVNFVENDFDKVVSMDRNWALGNYITTFTDYCKWCEYLNEKVTTKENLFSEVARIGRAYLRQKEQIDQEQFTKAMNMHKDEMEFEYGDFKVVLPTCPQDIKDEGVNMHHCVGGYAKNCMNFNNPNRSYIVFIRHKDTPNKCYITCEINNGHIGQYFLSYDRLISNDDDIAFRNAYANHLKNTCVRE